MATVSSIQRGKIGRTPRGSCNRTRLLAGFLEGSLKEVLLRRVLRRGREFYRRRLEGRNTPFGRVRPPSRAPQMNNMNRNVRAGFLAGEPLPWERTGPANVMLGPFYLKTQEIPNINSFEHKLLAVLRVAFKKLMPQNDYVVFRSLSVDVFHRAAKGDRKKGIGKR